MRVIQNVPRCKWKGEKCTCCSKLCGLNQQIKKTRSIERSKCELRKRLCQYGPIWAKVTTKI